MAAYAATYCLSRTLQGRAAFEARSRAAALSIAARAQLQTAHLQDEFCAAKSP